MTSEDTSGSSTGQGGHARGQGEYDQGQRVPAPTSYLRLALLAQPKQGMSEEERERWLEEFYQLAAREVKPRTP
ncbi:MAG: hypothetical protein ACYC66_15560 [Chloroflexota bacterium]